MKKNMTQDKTHWMQLADRYFDGTTSEAEERQLRRFAASREAADDADFNELRAVMGLFATLARITPHPSETGHARVSTSNENSLHAPHATPHAPRTSRIIGWSIGIAAALAVGLFVKPLLLPTKDVCRAWVNGKAVTDRQEVLAMMNESWKQIDIDHESTLMESQLADMFETLDNDN